jgi:hypothetical protein
MRNEQIKRLNRINEEIISLRQEARDILESSLGETLPQRLIKGYELNKVLGVRIEKPSWIETSLPAGQ